MILVFRIPLEESEYGRPDESSFHKIIPSKDTFVCNKPEESTNFGLVLSCPNFRPYLLLWDGVGSLFDAIGFLDIKGSL
jgi:hypothetical protein